MKKICLLCLLFVLSGCSVEYNLDIDKNINLIENISISTNSEEELQEMQDYNAYLPIDINIDDPSAFDERLDGIDYYNIKKDINNKKIIFNYDYDISKFNNNVFINSCYEHITTMKNKNDLILSTSKKFLCFDIYDKLDDVTVTITSKYKLKETNADIVEKHKYTWNINRDNANNKYLYLSLDTSKRDLTFLERLLEGEYFNIFTVSVLLFGIGLIIYFVIKKRGDRLNKV